MQYLSDLAHLYAAGLPIVFAPYALALILLGVVVGIVFGCLPGLTSTMSLAVFTPFTFGMTPGQALVFLTAIILGAVLGPMFEDNLRRAILLGNGSVLPFFTRPLSLLMILIIVAVVFRPALGRLAAAGGRAGTSRQP